MAGSLWLNEYGEWAVCDGPGPVGVTGYVLEVAGGGGWLIKDDIAQRRFLNCESAAATVLGKPFPEGLRYYVLRHEQERRIVLTYPKYSNASFTPEHGPRLHRPGRWRNWITNPNQWR